MTHFGELLEESRGGNAAMLAELIPLVYQELRRLASHQLRAWRRGGDATLQTTALVNEAYLRLAGQEELSWENRAHFRAIAAETMRRVLVDHARMLGARKRGAGVVKLPLESIGEPAVEADADVAAVDEALVRLAALDERAARVVTLRYFGGFSLEETADTLGISLTTVKRDWDVARAFLRRELSGQAVE